MTERYAPATQAVGAFWESALRPPYVHVRELVGELLFDRRYGIQTSDRAVSELLGIPRGTRRIAIRWTRLRRILRGHEISADDVFLDVGSGAGRAAFLAARFPFKRVVGIELEQRLVDLARQNIRRRRARLRCPETEFVTADGSTCEIPDDVTVVLLHNPFDGEPFHALVANILASLDRRPRPLSVMYENPREHEFLVATGRFHPVRLLRGWRPGQEWSRSNSMRLYEVS